jgi:D-sedoheptulose 7-phosphate isomerase
MKMTIQRFARDYQKQLTLGLGGLDLDELAVFVKELDRVRRQKKTVFLMGNGGSAATASHIANDLSKTAHVDGAPRLRAFCLADNVSFITAIANDISYDDIFSEQLRAAAVKGDLVVLISGSGNSPNVVRAAQYARERGLRTVGLLGFDGGKLKNMVDVLLHIESSQYGVVEDAHLSIGHTVSFYLKQADLARSTKQ